MELKVDRERERKKTDKFVEKEYRCLLLVQCHSQECNSGDIAYQETYKQLMGDQCISRLIDVFSAGQGDKICIQSNITMLFIKGRKYLDVVLNKEPTKPTHKSAVTR